MPWLLGDELEPLAAELPAPLLDPLGRRRAGAAGSSSTILGDGARLGCAARAGSGA